MALDLGWGLPRRPRSCWGFRRGQRFSRPAFALFLPAQRKPDMNRDNDQLNIGSESTMRWHTSASSSSAGVADDIFRLIPLNERAAFREMLEIEFHGRKLSDHEKRRAAERIWRSLLNYGWPT
jgi:hypothetical protein